LENSFNPIVLEKRFSMGKKQHACSRLGRRATRL